MTDAERIDQLESQVHSQATLLLHQVDTIQQLLGRIIALEARPVPAVMVPALLPPPYPEWHTTPNEWRDCKTTCRRTDGMIVPETCRAEPAESH